MGWKKLHVVLAPEPRYGHVGIYDSSRNRGIVIGGTDFDEAIASHFLEWNNGKWTVKPQSASPPPVSFPSMAFDPVREVAILLARDIHGNTMWEWNGASWRELSPAQMPTARVGGAMAFDSERQRLVLFGGRRADGNTFLNDTWEWDGNQWNQINPATSPAPRVSSALCYDPVRKVSILMGGSMNYLGRDFFGDTWAWNGTDWRLAASTGPKPRGDHSVVFDDSQGYVSMFGGTATKKGTPLTEVLNDSWIWSGESWLQVNDENPPPARANHMMFFDSSDKSIVLFGGRTSFGGDVLNDTWIWSQ